MKLMRLALVGVSALSLVPSGWADGLGWTNGANGTWRFIIMGDHRSKTTINSTFTGYVEGGVNVEALASLAAAARNEGAEFVLDVGDLVAKYDMKLTNVFGATTQEKAANFIASELAIWLPVWNQYSGGLPIFPVRGNHEATAPAAAWTSWLPNVPGMRDLMSQITLYSPPGEEGLTYAFAYKNCLLIGLDVFPTGVPKLPTLSESTRTWLADLLAASDRPFVFPFGHTPAYEVWDTEKPGGGVYYYSRDGLASPRPPSGTLGVLDSDAVNQVRDPFWNLLGGKKANYYCGHDHLYLRGIAMSSSGNSILQVIMGNGGAPAYPKYPDDPFVETSGTPMCTPPTIVPNYGSPKITKVYMDQDGSLGKISYGYLLVEIHGSHAIATYKVQNAINGEFRAKDTWTWKITDDEALDDELTLAK